MWWAMKRNSLSSNLPPQVTSLSRFILSNLDRGTATYITAAWAVSVLEMTRQLQAPKQSAQQPPIASMSCFTAWGGNNRPARSAFKVLFHLISFSKPHCCTRRHVAIIFFAEPETPSFYLFVTELSGARCTTYPGREERFRIRHKKFEAMTPSLYALCHSPLYNILK